MVANIGFLCHNIYMKTDIEIAREAKLNKIAEIADGLGIHDDNVIPYGKYIAKVLYSVIDDAKVKKNNLILVTAITPTKAGIGKTTVSIGLALGLNGSSKFGINHKWGWFPAVSLGWRLERRRSAGYLTTTRPRIFA